MLFRSIMSEIMIKDMLRYYYQELHAEEAQKYGQFLLENRRLMNIYKEYTEMLDNPTSSSISPSQQTLDRILQYAKDSIDPAA